MEAQILELGNRDSVKFSNYNSTLHTKIFAHGWNSDPTASYPVRDGSSFIRLIFKSDKHPVFDALEYLKQEDCNFIAVDWSHLATGFYYPRIATQYVPATATHVG